MCSCLPHALIKEESHVRRQRTFVSPISTDSYSLEVFGYQILATDSSRDGMIISKTYISLRVMVSPQESLVKLDVFGGCRKRAEAERTFAPTGIALQREEALCSE